MTTPRKHHDRLDTVAPGATGEGVIAVFNSGRAHDEAAVADTYTHIETDLPEDTVALSLLEIGEGDNTKLYSEAKLLARIFPSKVWRHLLMRKKRTKEPILVRRDAVRILVAAVTAIVAGGVPHQSPVRRLNSVGFMLGDVPVMLFNLHFAAGYKNGRRPSRVKALLGVSWHKSFFRLQKAVHRAVEAGYCVVITTDANDRRFPVTALHPNARAVAHEGPDYIITVAPDSYRDETTEHGSIGGNKIERLHNCLWARVKFTRRG